MHGEKRDRYVFRTVERLDLKSGKMPVLFSPFFVGPSHREAMKVNWPVVEARCGQAPPVNTKKQSHPGGGLCKSFHAEGPEGTTEISRWRKPPESASESDEPRMGRWKILEANRVLQSPHPGLFHFLAITGGLRHRLISTGPPGLADDFRRGLP